MNKQGFIDRFKELTGFRPFGWQIRLWELLVERPPEQWPDVVGIPTGLGKTHLITVWWCALEAVAEQGALGQFPRRLVYVVNRRTVVDQSTDVVAHLAERLQHDMQRLKELGLLPPAVSTLRGQRADNGEWRADPSRPAVIVGTVDMIGSRLLFGGYRIGFRSRPLHAGFLGQDALLIHDEAHLEPAFQRLVESIQVEQRREMKSGSVRPWPGLQVMQLSATTRSNRQGDTGPEQGEGRQFGLTEEEKNPPEPLPNQRTEPIHHLWYRMRAPKQLELHPVDDEKKVADRIVELALRHKGDGGAILVFARLLTDVERITDGLARKKDGVPQDRLQRLTGTMRGLERDELANRDPVFMRFLTESRRNPDVPVVEGTVYLVCTSAGEVGIDISADHMVCDLSTFESMAQRLGRVNRFGDREDTRVDVVHPADKVLDDKHPLTPAREATLRLLKSLDGDASSLALSRIDPGLREQGFAPTPTILEATDILFDTWAMTTIRGTIPGRPPLAPYLHGVVDWEPARTTVAWRDEVQCITDEVLGREGPDFPRAMLADYPLHPHELLSDTTERVLAELKQLAAIHPKAPVWLVDEQGEVTVGDLRQIANPAATKKPDRKRLEQAIANGIVLLPPKIGGLSHQGTLNGKLGPDTSRPHGYDVADRWQDDQGRPWRERRLTDSRDPDDISGMAHVRTIDLDPDAEEYAPAEIESEADDESSPNTPQTPSGGRFWHWYVRPREAEDATRASRVAVRLEPHTSDVVGHAREIVERLRLPEELQQAVVLAAEWHDLGKGREVWQRGIGNLAPESELFAKPGKHPDPNTRAWLRPRRGAPYRHEFGSLLDVLDPDQDHRKRLDQLSQPMQDVVLHLIAAHHGYARPHFTPEGIIDPLAKQTVAEDASIEVLRRFARLQRRYGRWGLAYLESLMRAADWAASAKPGNNGADS